MHQFDNRTDSENIGTTVCSECKSSEGVRMMRSRSSMHYDTS